MKKILIIVLIITCQVCFAAKKNPTGLDIADMVEDQDMGENSIAEMKMKLIRGANEKIREFYSARLEKGSEIIKNLIGFKSPKAIKGTGLLTFDKRKGDSIQWLYLPALKKVRKIATSGKGRPFVGSELFYEDMEQRHPSEDNHKRMKNQKYMGQNCYVLKSVAKGNSTYSYRIAWIDIKKLIALKVDFYDKKGRKIKQLKVKKIKRIQGIWTAMKIEIENISNKNKTILENIWIKYNVKGLNDKFFVKTNLKRNIDVAKFK